MLVDQFICKGISCLCLLLPSAMPNFNTQQLKTNETSFFRFNQRFIINMYKIMTQAYIKK